MYAQMGGSGSPDFSRCPPPTHLDAWMIGSIAMVNPPAILPTPKGFHAVVRSVLVRTEPQILEGVLVQDQGQGRKCGTDPKALARSRIETCGSLFLPFSVARIWCHIMLVCSKHPVEHVILAFCYGVSVKLFCFRLVVIF